MRQLQPAFDRLRQQVASHLKTAIDDAIAAELASHLDAGSFRVPTPDDGSQAAEDMVRRPHDLAAAQLEVLAALREFGPQTADALATACGVSRGTVHFNINRLQDLVVTLPAPGRGNCKVYVAAD